MAEKVEPSKGEAQDIEAKEEGEREEEGREVEDLLVTEGAASGDFVKKEREAESEEIAGENAEGEDVETRVELPIILNVNETLQIQSNPLCLELRVSGRENCDDEIE